MNNPRRLVIRALSSSLLAAGLLAAQNTTTPQYNGTNNNNNNNTYNNGTVQPDNTKMNKGDASRTSVTADQQKNDKSDRELTRQIRKAIMDDKSLSTYAHNVKIISQNGTVTLKGPVRSDDEKKTIEAKAAEIAGDKGKIDDQMSVKE